MKALPDIAIDRAGELAYPFPRRDEGLGDGLAIARRERGWTFIALPAPIIAAPALVAAARSLPVVAWSSRTLTLVGIGAAYELRGSGSERWHELVAAARRIETSPPATIPQHHVIVGRNDPSLVRPRLLGGLAFAPGAADRAPWTGFGDAWFMLPRWTYVHDGLHAALVLAVDARDALQVSRWHDELSGLRDALATTFTARPQPPLISIDPGDRGDWRAQVRAITDSIERGECAKIVAARNAVITLAGDVRPADMLAELDARHADCVRVLVKPPGGGALIAATPERLVRLEDSNVACDALAGSLARGDEDAATLLASTKDRREHDLVVHAITSALLELGADVTAPTPPTIRTLRHVLHLHTPIAARLQSRRHVLELAAALHPTPAVGGTPTRTALDWIASRESVPRGWYAAPVGWFDLAGNGELAVAIRSGLLANTRAHLWAGAGIVSGSDPDRELAETEIKLRAILHPLGVQ